MNDQKDIVEGVINTTWVITLETRVLILGSANPQALG